MRIAFDVKGTIEGHKKDLILKLFKGLQAKGHECLVWSNSYKYAVGAVKLNNLNAEPSDKVMMMDAVNYGFEPVDLAVEDDHSQTWLASRRFLFVDAITEELIQQILADDNNIKLLTVVS